MTIIRDMSDIDAGLVHLVALDPRLETIVAASGAVPLRLSEPGFASLASIIVSQMVSKASAAAIWNRILAEGPVTPENYLATAPDVAATFGLSRAKAKTLAGLAEAIVAGRVDLDALLQMPPEDAIAALTGLPGIGPWTAEVYLMFCGGHVDVFPSGDVALQAAVAHAFTLEARPSARQLRQLATIWSPWRSVAARLFWAYYATHMRRDALPTL
ncbi:DNA-3-methyladenine glycosylase [Neorhizobium sp. JUb45]|uniref:DNA-3-methyladenine glycosylase family protein n=1 Tax=unclassified Neorhizobium TaxID=2629175 RepID=UPI001051DCF5|nr:DNA-3-methyladenine glycosylase [Neorhizobium sp. JUb45]TCR01106.1 DNA-3-methyladenine glycosylase II [Neorhizobium sp. JUb45]